MAEINKQMVERPTQIILHKISRTLELQYADNKHYVLSAQFLRAHSPSADMRYEKLATQDATEKMARFQHVNILSVEPVGNYAIRLIFSDGHQTGIYSWETLLQFINENQGN